MKKSLLKIIVSMCFIPVLIFTLFCGCSKEAKLSDIINVTRSDITRITITDSRNIDNAVMFTNKEKIDGIFNLIDKTTLKETSNTDNGFYYTIEFFNNNTEKGKIMVGNSLKAEDKSYEIKSGLTLEEVSKYFK